MNNIYQKNLLAIMAKKNNHWGYPAYWSHKNYKMLSDDIFKVSGYIISEQTLKRLFGKVKTEKNYSPHIETLNALSIYCGYSSWDSFISQTDPSPASISATHPQKMSGMFRLKSRLFYLIASVLFLTSGLLAFLFLFSYDRENKATAVSDYDFTFEGLVTEGYVPYTVVFRYDISNIEDSVFFQAGGEPKKYLSKENTSFSNTFLTPNFYRGQVIIGNKPVKTIPLHNKSKNWILGYNYRRLSSGYWQAYKPFFEHPEISNPQGTLYYPLDSLLLLESDIDKDDLWTDIRYYNTFDVDLDSCIIESRFKCHTRFSFMIGAEHIIRLAGEYGNVQLHFVQKGFESHVVVTVSEHEFSGHYHDMAVFALEDIYSWNEYRLQVIHNEASIYINDALAFTVPYTERLGNFKGLRMSFRGVGKIDYFRVKKPNGDLVYAEDFTD